MISWHVGRKRTKIRDSNQCQFKQFDFLHEIKCKGRMDVHHIIPQNDGGNNHIDNLICLCRTHHMRVHSSLLGCTYGSMKKILINLDDDIYEEIRFIAFKKRCRKLAVIRDMLAAGLAKTKEAGK